MRVCHSLRCCGAPAATLRRSSRNTVCGALLTSALAGGAACERVSLRQGIAVLLVHHAGTNSRQRGTSRREDALDTVIALRRPEDYSPEQGARFEVHFEKLRNRVEGDAAVPFEAKLDEISDDEANGIRWIACDLRPPVLKEAAALFQDGLTVREVAEAT
jgi:putative DNA primase/helicase